MTEEGGSISEEFRQEGIADRVSTFGTAFLGLTLKCARCHDHKYDPIPTREFYGLAAMFGSGWWARDVQGWMGNPPIVAIWPKGVSTLVVQPEQASEIVAGGKINEPEQVVEAALLTMGAGQATTGGVVSCNLITWMHDQGLPLPGEVERHQS